MAVGGQQDTATKDKTHNFPIPMIRPACYNIPEGKSEQEALPDELLELLANVFQGVTCAFGDNAILYRLDIGRVYESVQSGDLVVAGQFVDRSDGEVFDFEINQGTNKVGYKSSGDFLDRNALSLFLGEEAGSSDEDDNSSESSESEPYPFDLLLQAINEEGSEAYQSPFASKLRKDLDYLGALSALMYHAGATIEAQPLYTGLHSYAIKYALRGLRLFSQSISSTQGRESAESWVDEHGLDFAAAVVKEFSSRRCVRFQESIQSEDQEGIQELKDLVEEAIGMAMATTSDLIKSVVEADDYHAGDVQATLAAAIEEYCPIDNSEGYNAVDNARQLSAEWQEVVSRSGCMEDLSMSAIGLPAAHFIPSEKGASHDRATEPLQDSGPDEETELVGERIFYVNVGEGPFRNWDDCRKFGFLSAGCGRKWSKQLEKIKPGDQVIAYLKGYGYVGIGTVTKASTPCSQFLVDGTPIKELPLINDTIRSVKRFNKENGEYLIGVDWQAAVPRDQAAWKASAGLFTTALVCASLRNQKPTIDFARSSLLSCQGEIDNHSQRRMTSAQAIRVLTGDEEEDEKSIQYEGFDYTLDKLTQCDWASEEEFCHFFIAACLSVYESMKTDEVTLFEHEVMYSFCPNSSIWDLWTKARKMTPKVNNMAAEMGLPTDEMRDDYLISSIFNVFPAALRLNYDQQSLGEWLAANSSDCLSHEDNEFMAILVALLEPDDTALLDIVSNLKSSSVLDELVFGRPDIVISDDLLCYGYGGSGLLHNSSLSADALMYLAALLTGIDPGDDFWLKNSKRAAFTPEDLRSEMGDSIDEINRSEVIRLICNHPNCTESIRVGLLAD